MKLIIPEMNPSMGTYRLITCQNCLLMSLVICAFLNTAHGTKDGTNDGIFDGYLIGILLGAEFGTVDGDILGSDDGLSLGHSLVLLL